MLKYMRGFDCLGVSMVEATGPTEEEYARLNEKMAREQRDFDLMAAEIGSLQLAGTADRINEVVYEVAKRYFKEVALVWNLNDICVAVLDAELEMMVWIPFTKFGPMFAIGAEADPYSKIAAGKN
ncbi:hypothetical protein BcepSauron_316 [Burkholderia phage BcepSauron]|uniref:Uncharacterized protein n=1 Tax=Burkholderia phage BcepSauron TaxID=2530033 RepID=A0A482MME3_9CAUD|nr:hypothetical protein H1O17_gp316 [Burkholderia phage BcepSauron]QBQ74696.1 hypothetical protein BcepSauron_316 [Burkholderia phage BcepSauron]